MGRALGAAAEAGDVIALLGDLGAGKTFIAQAIARGAGVPPTVRVTSPTFTVMQSYEGRLPVFHADLYRLHRAAELDEIGLFPLAADGLAIVEWPDRMPEAIPADALWLELKAVSATQRELRAGVTGPRGRRLLDALRPR